MQIQLAHEQLFQILAATLGKPHTHLQELSTGNMSKHTNQYVIAGSKHIPFSYMHSRPLHVQFDGPDFRRFGYTLQHSSDSLQFENSMFGGWVAWGHRVIGS